MKRRLSTHIIAALLLLVHASLLTYSASRRGATFLEPAFLVSGISHWQQGRFELFRVNPPLVRMVAVLPVLILGYQTDWTNSYDGPGSRAEYQLGCDFAKANTSNFMELLFYARCACIPFSLIGAYFAFRWATELYGNAAGLLAISLYIFEPNLLAHGGLITTDAACTALGIVAGYTFWNWLKQPTWLRAIVAGTALGVAELTKLTWIILFICWPVLWAAWRCSTTQTTQRSTSTDKPFYVNAVSRHRLMPEASIFPTCPQLLTALGIGLYVLNLGYSFEGFATKLEDYTFVSKTLTGLDSSGAPGNRFRNSFFSHLPIPLPRQYVNGIDSQTRDFEAYSQHSFLRGEWKQGGWWYYYIYGLWIKVPSSDWLLFALVITLKTLQPRVLHMSDELILLSPAVFVIALASAQTTFCIHLRYVFPSLGIGLIFVSQIFALTHSRYFALTRLAFALVLYSILSCLCAYPHHFEYFNEFVGGSAYGQEHLRGSSSSWDFSFDQ